MAHKIFYMDEEYPDGSGGGSVFTPIIYSSEERCIGTWKDDKPLYQKTYDVGALPNNTSKNVTTLSGIDVVEMVGVAYSSNVSGNTRPLPLASGGSNDIRVDVSSNVLRVITYADWSTYNGCITIKYTKNSDVAGSAPFNSLGVPTVHYSTEEHAIGTWIDGKPLYQKTIEIPSIPQNNSDTFSYGINEAITIRDYKCIIVYGSGNDQLYWDINVPRPDANNSAIYSIATKTGFFIRTFTAWTASANLTIWYTNDND